jgi:hypothetical protein
MHRASCGAIGLALVVAAAGCNAILGNEPPTLRDGATSAGDDGGIADAHAEAVAPLPDGGCPAETKSCGTACFNLSNDPANCGACGNVCEDGCTTGLCAPKLLLGKMASPFALAVDSTNVYVIDRGATTTTGRVVRVPIAGGAPTDIAVNLDRPYAIAADAAPGVTDVYFSTFGSTGKVSRYRGTAVADLPDKTVNNGVSGNKVHGLFVETSNLWGTDEDNGGRIWRASRNGSIDAQENVAKTGVLPATIEVKNNVAYVVERLDGQCHPSSSVVKWAPGSASLTSVPGGSCAYGMTVITGDIFFTERNSPGALRKNGTVTPLADQLAYPNALATDNVTLYWTNQGAGASDGSIERIDVAAPMRPRAVLARGRVQPIAIAVDKTYVYWLEGSGVGTTGELYRLRR